MMSRRKKIKRYPLFLKLSFPYINFNNLKVYLKLRVQVTFSIKLDQIALAVSLMWTFGTCHLLSSSICKNCFFSLNLVHFIHPLKEAKK